MRRCFLMLSASLLIGSVQAESGPETARQAEIHKVVEKIHELYIDPDKVKNIGRALQRAEFARPMSDEAFAKKVTDILSNETRDPHLRLMYSVTPTSSGSSAAPTSSEIARREEYLRAQNHGIERVERLPGNIGYLRTRFFAPVTSSAPSIGAAMTLLANTDALIIDLRDNDGGSSAAVPFMASYLFDERKHIADLYTRKGDRTEQQWTSPAVPGVRYGGEKDVYLLTSKSTFSAAEGLAFALRGQKRVTIVGETTRGGAHPSSIERISPHLALMVPTSTARDPVTLQDWEGVGVAPDVAVPAVEALTRAQILILNKLELDERDAASRAEVQARLIELAPSS
ncbi:S41 family peptidase [Telluria beijingensis]|uniref:S41 family peptidase n=1 Tax=Telluria beijingensis TaxID=3068633 RepID=UPI00279604F4|nr:S41 family peptidase [Massilia sp. REN29]